jgi:amino acid permease
MPGFEIRAKAGGLFLAAAGLFFVLAATAILVFAVVSTWGFAGSVDRLLQLVLLGCAGFGFLLARYSMKRTNG